MLYIFNKNNPMLKNIFYICVNLLNSYNLLILFELYVLLYVLKKVIDAKLFAKHTFAKYIKFLSLFYSLLNNKKILHQKFSFNSLYILHFTQYSILQYNKNQLQNNKN